MAFPQPFPRAELRFTIQTPEQGEEHAIALQTQLRILLIHQQRVMLSDDVAALYGVETKALNRTVKRNAERFPGDFMFQLTNEEWGDLKHQIDASSWGGSRIPLCLHRAAVGPWEHLNFCAASEEGFW